jgi:hypothetical protein
VSLLVCPDKIAVMKLCWPVFSEDSEQPFLLPVGHTVACASEADFHTVPWACPVEHRDEVRPFNITMETLIQPLRFI